MDTPNTNGLDRTLEATGGAAADDGWTQPQGMHIPDPTYMPLVLAIGAMCILWGIVTTPLMSLVGGILFIIGISGWIGELRHEHRE